MKKEEADKIVANLSVNLMNKALKKAADKQLEKAKNITPVTVLETEPKLKTYKYSVDSALDVLRNEIEDINRQQYELDQRKADIYQKLWDMLGGVS